MGNRALGVAIQDQALREGTVFPRQATAWRAGACWLSLTGTHPSLPRIPPGAEYLVRTPAKYQLVGVPCSWQRRASIRYFDNLLCLGVWRSGAIEIPDSWSSEFLQYSSTVFTLSIRYPAGLKSQNCETPFLMSVIAAFRYDTSPLAVLDLITGFLNMLN